MRSPRPRRHLHTRALPCFRRSERSRRAYLAWIEEEGRRGLVGFEVSGTARAGRRGVLCFAQSASAATLTVDDDRADCPAAALHVDPGRGRRRRARRHGRHLPRQLRRGHGRGRHQRADDRQEPDAQGRRRRPGHDHAEVLRARRRPDPRGHARTSATASATSSPIVGTPSQPLTVNISGVTVDGRTRGRRSPSRPASSTSTRRARSTAARVTNVVTSEGDDAYTRAGGYRGTQPGIGIAQVTNALLRAGRRRAPLTHRPHARRQVQPDRRPDRRRDRTTRRRSSPRARSTGASSIASQIIGRTAVHQLRRAPATAPAATAPWRPAAHHRPAVRPGRPARHRRLLRDRRRAR